MLLPDRKRSGSGNSADKRTKGSDCYKKRESMGICIHPCAFRYIYRVHPLSGYIGICHQFSKIPAAGLNMGRAGQLYQHLSQQPVFPIPEEYLCLYGDFRALQHPAGIFHCIDDDGIHQKIPDIL